MSQERKHGCSPEEFEEWAQDVMREGSRTVYSGASLRCLAMPMGGIGAGNFALAGDGTLRQWQILNQVNHTAFLPDTFFAIWARAGRGARAPVARLLQTDCFYWDDFEPAASTSDHVIPEQALAWGIDGVEDIQYVGEYPIAELEYLDSELPVEVRLQAFSPMVPLNARDSGLPAAIFVFAVKNTGDAPVAVTLAGSLQNAVGYDGGSGIAGNRCECYGGNCNEAVRRSGMTAVSMSNARLPRDDESNGSMALAVLSEDAMVQERWRDLEAFWNRFATDGRLGPATPGGESPPGETFNGTVAVPMQLDPGEERQVTFVIAWHFPNHYVNWDQAGFGITDRKSKLYLGNMYNNWFDSALGVVEHVGDNFDRLAEQTRRFRDSFYDSTLPYWLLDAVTSQASTIRTPTCIWNEDGNLHAFEGCRGAVHGEWGLSTGCCPLNCTHVWNYEMTLSRLYPDLERTMRRTDWKVQQTDEGAVIFRTVLPLYLPRWSVDPGQFERTNIACDGHWGTVLKTYREFQQSGAREFLDGMWPNVKQAMEYGFATWDEDADGVCDGPQWNTYDLYFHGKNTFCSSLYLAALRACEEMAKVQGDEELAGECRRRFEAGSKIIDEELFNGEYYEQRFDESIESADYHQYGKGCLSDQLFGQWWAHTLGLGYILDAEKVRAALAAIYKHNFRHDLVGHVQQPRIFASEWEKGLLTTTWPHGGRQDRPMLYCDEVWTGIEYHVASHMLYEGMIEEAFHLVKAARDRHNGVTRNPWCEIECGDHYARPMSSWALLEGASGRVYDASRGMLGFDPRVTPEDFRGFFITAAGWGTFSQQRSEGAQENALELAYGELRLELLRLGLPDDGGEPTKVEVGLDDKTVTAEWQIVDGQLCLNFVGGVQLSEGAHLTVSIAW